MDLGYLNNWGIFPEFGQGSASYLRLIYLNIDQNKSSLIFSGKYLPKCLNLRNFEEYPVMYSENQKLDIGLTITHIT